MTSGNRYSRGDSPAQPACMTLARPCNRLEGGSRGGGIIAEGTLEQLTDTKGSYAAKFLSVARF